MKHNPVSDFWYQLFALILAVIIVHAIYVTVVRPRAEAIFAEQRAKQAAGEVFEMPRSVYIVVKDWEQESCFILAIWALTIMGLKINLVIHERKLLSQSLLEVTPGTSILPEDTRQYARSLQALPENERQYLLPRALLTALQRFGSTRDIQNVCTAVREVCET